jgi:hypothetical protein
VPADEPAVALLDAIVVPRARPANPPIMSPVPVTAPPAELPVTLFAPSRPPNPPTLVRPLTVAVEWLLAIVAKFAIEPMSAPTLSRPVTWPPTSLTFLISWQQMELVLLKNPTSSWAGRLMTRFWISKSP